MLGYGMVSFVPYRVAVDPLKNPGTLVDCARRRGLHDVAEEVLDVTVEGEAVPEHRRLDRCPEARLFEGDRGVVRGCEGAVGRVEEEVAAGDSLGEVAERRVREVS